MNAKNIAKQWIFGGAYVDQPANLGILAPQQEVSVHLDGEDGSFDVTHANAICSLNPLRIGIGLPTVPSGSQHQLRFTHVASNTLLATIAVVLDRELSVGPHSLYMFPAVSSRRYFPGLLQQWAGSGWLRLRHAKAGESPHASDVDALQRKAVFAFYMCPRPLAIVTSGESSGFNLFPMDLTGRIAPGWASFCLGADKPVVGLIRSSGRLVVSSVPSDAAPLAFACGKNHRVRVTGEASLPFALCRHTQLSLPVPAFAINATEYAVEEVHRLGSHTLFIGREVEFLSLQSAPQLHLTMATYKVVRERHLATNSVASLVSTHTVQS